MVMIIVNEGKETKVAVAWETDSNTSIQFHKSVSQIVNQ